MTRVAGPSGPLTDLERDFMFDRGWLDGVPPGANVSIEKILAEGDDFIFCMSDGRTFVCNSGVQTSDLGFQWSPDTARALAAFRRLIRS